MNATSSRRYITKPPINDARFENVKVYPHSPFVVILLHGLYPDGQLHFKRTFKQLSLLLQHNHITHLYHYRTSTFRFDKLPANKDLIEKVNGRNAVRKETYNMIHEYNMLLDLLEFFETTHGLRNTKYVLIGHSTGGFYASVLGNMLKKRCVRSISLDGFNFYSTYVFFVKYRLNLPCEESDLKYTPTGIYYKNRLLNLEKMDVDHALYILSYQYRNCKPKHHIMLEYFENKLRPKEVMIRKIKSNHYENVYAVKYKKKYYHSLHMFKLVADAIYERFVHDLVMKM